MIIYDANPRELSYIRFLDTRIKHHFYLLAIINWNIQILFKKIHFTIKTKTIQYQGLNLIKMCKTFIKKLIKVE